LRNLSGGESFGPYPCNSIPNLVYRREKKAVSPGVGKGKRRGRKYYKKIWFEVRGPHRGRTRAGVGQGGWGYQFTPEGRCLCENLTITAGKENIPKTKPESFIPDQNKGEWGKGRVSGRVEEAITKGVKRSNQKVGMVYIYIRIQQGGMVFIFAPLLWVG